MKELSEIVKEEALQYINSKEGKKRIRKFVKEKINDILDEVHLEDLLEREDSDELWKTISRHIFNRVVSGFNEE